MSKLMEQALKEGCDENLYVYEFDNHYKSLVKNSEYFITGSINWLSNKQGKNFERAWKTEISELADREFEDHRNYRQKRLILRRKSKPFVNGLTKVDEKVEKPTIGKGLRTLFWFLVLAIADLV